MKKLLSIFLIAILLVSVPFSTALPEADASGSSWFTDVSSNKWYYNSVKFVCDTGLMVGTSETKFSPEEDFSRAMIVTVLWRLEGEPSAPANSFTDVRSGKWYTKPISWAAHSGIVLGTGNNKFEPDSPVTREQMTSIFMRYANALGLDTSARADINSYSDSINISSFAKIPMKWAIASNLINGVGKNKLDPRGNATRAQSAAILERFIYEVLLNPELWPEENYPTDDPTDDPIDDPTDDPTDVPIDDTSDFADKYQNFITNTYEYNNNYHITSPVTNNNSIIPPEQQGLASGERYASAETKYDFDKNPLINRDREVNMNVLPSFDIDSTNFVRAGTKLSDLNGKTLKFFTADTYAAWSYRNRMGQTIDEWQWFYELKDELGLNIKYTMKQHDNSSAAVLQAMTAGLQCDVIYSNHAILTPKSLILSKPLKNTANLDNLGKTPGVCERTMRITKWAGEERVVAPIGVVDVLWYNQTLGQQLGLSDPHVMWENGKWNWDSFKKYMLSIPRTDNLDRALVAWTCFPTNIYFTWDTTNGKAATQIVTNAKVPAIQNNWTNPQVLEAWEFICDVNSKVNFKCGEDNGGLGTVPEHMGLYLGTTMMSATMYTQVYRDTQYSKHIQINWVPYPKANTSTGRETAQYYGFGMLLPRQTVMPENTGVALKFMELWANRFTEAYYDNLNTFEYYNFNYNQRKQYFNFVTSHLVYSPATSKVYTYGYMLHAFMGNSYYSVSDEAVKYASRQANDIANAMRFGL